jgi:hypothetical protein
MNKTCSSCEQEKPIALFTKRSNNRVGSYCLECYRSYQKEYYKDNTEAYQAKNQLHRDRLANIIVKAKDVPCKDCKQKFPSYCMDFDHLRDKKFCIAQATQLGVSFKTLREEIGKCDIVCAVCHRKRTHDRNAG